MRFLVNALHTLAADLQQVFYTDIRPAEGQTEDQVKEIAKRLGYVLIPFEGYTNVDLGMPGNHGPKWEESRENFKRIMKIQDEAMITFPDGTVDHPHIIAVNLEELNRRNYLTDEEGDALLRYLMK